MHDKPYKQIVILSGKGGTGKTTLSAAFASLINNKVIIDCDVDAANLHLVLKPKIVNRYEFYGGKKATIDRSKCKECGLCEAVCRFSTISNYVVDQIRCEGCGFCYRICPYDAIKFNPSKSGSFFECEIKDKSKFYYAKLYPGEGNSGKLVSEIKKKALENISSEIEWVIVDGPPGIGCPVNASLAAVDYAVIVTEPTVSGIHDLKRLVELLSTFKIHSGIVINKYDLNLEITTEIFKYAENKKIPVIGSIPFDEKFVKALICGHNVVEEDQTIRNEISIIWKQLEMQIEITAN
ncbi:ATP-binding protein [Melioribacter sp. OK-6-Me]|uniref:ATP-binding protein n=1 Tax=unclassified Melioribacter TaxID=2627329 RepID=UPI003ED87BFD